MTLINEFSNLIVPVISHMIHISLEIANSEIKVKNLMSAANKLLGIENKLKTTLETTTKVYLFIC